MNKNAPGAPGIKAKWTSSAKSGLGKSINTSSDVVFTISHGILNEVYFPREDNACLRDMGFIVTDGKEFFSEEKRDTDHDTHMIEDNIPAYEVINTCKENRYKIIKEVLVDPFRNTILQKISFHPQTEGNYRLFVLVAPHLNNQGDHNTGWVGDYEGIPMLYASGGPISMAVACSSGWAKRSVGYVGTSDGWTDLKQHKEMNWQYTHAEDGNVCLTGEIDISQNRDFVLALSFGTNPAEAGFYAWSSILDGFGSAKKWYMDEWDHWLKKLHDTECKYYKISAAVLRMHEAKEFPGGIIASMSIPWGNAKGDIDRGGYHLVWPRDLVETAGGFIALKSRDDALRVINYLMSTQEPDGSWPQNMWLNGEVYWPGRQTDQTALPLLLVDKCWQNRVLDEERMRRYWPILKKAIGYLIRNGMYTEQDRWEEEQGYTPFTMATVVSGILVAADLADANNEKELAAYCRETADYWNGDIERRIYVTGTPLAKKYGVEGYYIRLNPYLDIPASELGDEKYVYLKNHYGEEGKTLLNELVSIDALALVRSGLRSAHDPRILNTIRVIDAMLKTDTLNGTGWHRYNNDGYGEHQNGNPYDGTGIGRVWPLLSGERGHYEVAAGNIEKAKVLLKAMEDFSNNGLIPEQVWDSDDIPEKELFKGKHSGSAMPLAWAHSEYIKLSTSIQDKKVFDMPTQTYERYVVKKTISPYTIWRFNDRCRKISKEKTLRIEVMSEAVIHWTDDNWNTVKDTHTKNTGTGVFIGDIDIRESSADHILFTFFWTGSNKWENQNFSIEIEKPPHEAFEERPHEMHQV